MRLSPNRTKLFLLLSVLAFGCLTVLWYSELDFFSDFDWKVFWIAYVGVALFAISFGTTLLTMILRRR